MPESLVSVLADYDKTVSDFLSKVEVDPTEQQSAAHADTLADLAIRFAHAVRPLV
jgi:hypothetical protein